VFWLAFLAGQPGAGAVGVAKQSPEETVKTVTTEMLTALRSQQEAYKNDPRKMVSLIERIIVPHFDIRVMAREALGLNWRRATPEQQKRFMTAFRKLLVNDYADEFSNYSNQAVEFLPEQPGSGKDYALVSTHVTSPGEQPVKVDYRLYRVESDWRIYDMDIDNISLLFTPTLHKSPLPPEGVAKDIRATVGCAVRTIPNKELRLLSGAHGAPYIAISTPSTGEGLFLEFTGSEHQNHLQTARYP